MGVNIIVNKSDCRRESSRPYGPGAWNGRGPDFTVRFTHLPTGISSQASSERTLWKNERLAWKLLVAKINAAHDRTMSVKGERPVRSYYLAPSYALRVQEGDKVLMTGSAVFELVNRGVGLDGVMLRSRRP